MNYFYFNPISKQYFFPTSYQKYQILNTFYHPYKRITKLIWKLWSFFSPIRYLFLTKNIQSYLPFNNICRYIPENSIVAFNRGTPGLEQKITALVVKENNKESLFLKYGESKISRQNIDNEGETLQQLSHLNFVPHLKQFIKKDDYTLIITDTFVGKRFKNEPINENILEVLIKINTQKTKTKRIFQFELTLCFSHGDFCPWNMIDTNGNIKVYDWEMAGIYPLGYDLFTYIFQVEFLLNKKYRFKELLEYNNDNINNYFKKFDITNWKPYLSAFVKLKIEFESIKKNQKLLPFYNKLAIYATTI